MISRSLIVLNIFYKTPVKNVLELSIIKYVSRCSMNISEWFKSLSQKQRKQLISLLFEMRGDTRYHPCSKLYENLLKVMDNEYHLLKEDGEED